MKEEAMKDFDWRLRYAPHGYQYAKHRITFDTLHYAHDPSVVIHHCMDRLLTQVSRQTGDVTESDVFTRITVYPKQTGETLNHLDPLVPRFGIEVEIRYPTEPRP